MGEATKFEIACADLDDDTRGVIEELAETYKENAVFEALQGEPSSLDTGEMLSKMFVENTGVDCMDSGGDEGRHWQRNQKKSVADEPETFLGAEVYGPDDDKSIDIQPVLSAYHFCAERLAYDAVMDAQFQAWRDMPDNRRVADLILMENWVNKRFDGEATGLYGEGEPMMVNTYNHDSLLDQVLQYIYFEVHGTAYVLLQVHGGADVRGGYTTPRVFTADDERILFDRDASITCCNDTCNSSWRTDDTYHWYEDGCSGASYTNLEKYPFEEVKETPAIDEDEGPGKIYIVDGTMHCPLCGEELFLSP